VQLMIVGPSFVISKTKLAVKKQFEIGICLYICDDTTLKVSNKKALNSDGYTSVTPECSKSVCY
jgi:hypothetical protein